MPSNRTLLRILRLGASGYDKDGWVRISAMLWPMLSRLDHGGLLEFKPGHLRLSAQGRILLWVVEGNVPAANH